MLRSEEYQKYLIARDYKPHKVRRQFSNIKSITRSEARKSKLQGEYKSFPLITEYNPLLTNLNSVIKRNLPLLYSDSDMKETFPEGSVKVIYRRGKNLKELLSPSCFATKQKLTASSLSKYNGRCDICKNFMVFSNRFECTVTGKSYKVNGVLSCNSKSVIYLITCNNCKDKYVGSVINFKG